MNYYILDKLLFVIIVSLMFENIPSILAIGIIGGNLGNKLVIYPLAVGMIYTMIMYLKHKASIKDFSVLRQYLIVYFLIISASIMIGAYKFPFYNDLISITNNISKIYIIDEYLTKLGFTIDKTIFFQCALLLRGLKNVLLEIFWNIGGAYLLFIWYKGRWNEAKKIIIKAIYFCAVFLSLYSTIEVMHLYGNMWAKNTIKSLTPLIHNVGQTDWGWPPALWNSGVRMVFDEPSFLGNYIPFLFPLLWLIYQTNKNKMALFLIGYLSFAVFMSNSRTCYAMIFGCLFVYLIFVLFSKERDYISTFFMISCFTFLGFFGHLFMMNTPRDILSFNTSMIETKYEAIEKKVTVKEILENNFTNLSSDNKRSNKTRYGVMKANIRVFEDNVLFGVGKGMSAAYAVRKYNDEEKADFEISRWIEMYHKEGPIGKNVLSNGFCEYVTRLAETGLLGLILYLLPFLYLLRNAFLNFNKKYYIDYCFLITSFIGTLISGFNVSLDIVWTIWPIFAFLLILTEESIIEVRKDKTV